MQTIHTDDLNTVTGAVTTSRSSTSDQLLTTLGTINSSIADIKNQSNQGFSNPTTMLLFALLASQRNNQPSSTTVVYRRGWW